MSSSISDRSFEAMRCGAGMVHAIGPVRLRVQHGERVLVEACRPPLPDAPPHLVVPPCGFRAAVARAHGLRRVGVELAFLGLHVADPEIAYGVATGDRVLPGGIVRVTIRDALVHAVAVPLAYSAACAAIAPAAAAVVDSLGLHGDDDLEVTLLHTVGPAGSISTAATDLDRLEEVLALCAVAEVEAHLGSGVP